MIRRLEAEEDITQALAGDRLGLPAVLFFVMSAAAPLTVVAGVLTTAYAVTGNVGLPSAFIVVGVVLTLFSVGYVTMSRHLPHAGAFYAYVSHGVGRTFGVGAAWVALFAYNLLQVGLYGAVGVASAPLVQDWIGITLPWWVFALIAWAMVAVLGVFRVDINGQVLAVLLVIEVALILVYDVSYLAHPAHGLDFALFSPTELFKPGVGAILAIAVLGFVGFESAVVFTEESRNPRRTVPLATYVSVVVIAAVYGLSSWAMAVSVGADKIAEAAQKQGPEVLFTLADAQMGTPVAMLGRLLFVTSLIAAMISFHNTIARYGFALGRERVMPELFGGTSSSGAPRAGSMAQSVIALIVILVYAVTGLDPLVQLFYTAGTSGALGILLLLGGACIAVLLFFARNRRGESLWHTVVAPVLAMLGIGGILVLVLANFATLLGVPESSPLRWGIPASFVVVGLAGIGYGLMLKIRRPQVYASIGLGAKSAEVGQPGRAAHRAPMPVASEPVPPAWDA
jgi:amino acid transporter